VTALLLILAALGTMVLLIAAVVAALRRRTHSAVRRGAAAVVLVATYAIALIAVGVASRARTLSDGEWKCFDDWCVTVASAVPAADRRDVSQMVRHPRPGPAQRPAPPHA
jgi:hypothetical protein